VLYVIYRTLGEAFSGPAGPIPGWMQLSVLGGALVGIGLVLAGWQAARARIGQELAQAPTVVGTSDATPRHPVHMN
jgi:hypothetical protein